jgi:signal transduction histidine kinase/CheY-like chemotaxis protein
MPAPQAPIRVLVVDDDARVARALGSVLAVQGCTCRTADSAEGADQAAAHEPIDVLLADYQLADTTGIQVWKRLHAAGHPLPCVIITGSVLDIPEEERSQAVAVLQKPFPAALLYETVLRAATTSSSTLKEIEPAAGPALAHAIQTLALARDQRAVIDAALHATRTLIGTDGAAFVLREDDLAHYVDEDAIGPLFKGRRLPLDACVSGLSILERNTIVVPNIYEDPRISHEDYAPTFVRGVASVPIRTSDPIGAVVAYWAREHVATNEELEILQSLADSAAVALQNVALITDLENRVARRTQELASANRELELFTGAAAHDVSGPLAMVYANAETVLLGAGPDLQPSDRACIDEIRGAALEMSSILGNLLRLSRMSASDVRRHRVDVSALAEQLVAELRAREPGRRVHVEIDPGLSVVADPELTRIALQNLLGNAWKFTGKREHAHIVVGQAQTDLGRALFVRDDGAGFDPAKAGQLFLPFRRLHDQREFAGTGVGLVTVARIAAKHGGHVWAESEIDRGATFYLQLGGVDSAAHVSQAAAAVRRG